LHTRPLRIDIWPGLVVGITIARTLHTLWMLREERRRERARGVGTSASLPQDDRVASAETGAKTADNSAAA